MGNKMKINLAELVSEQAELTLPDGKVVNIDPPEVEDFVNLAKLQSEALSAEEDADAVAVAELFGTMKAELVKLVPPLEGHKLNLPMVMRMISSLQQLCFPEDVEELEKMGITLTDDQKKEILTSSTK